MGTLTQGQVVAYIIICRRYLCVELANLIVTVTKALAVCLTGYHIEVKSGMEYGVQSFDTAIKNVSYNENIVEFKNVSLKYDGIVKDVLTVSSS